MEIETKQKNPEVIGKNDEGVAVYVLFMFNLTLPYFLENKVPLNG
jgi:hypothetical protein